MRDIMKDAAVITVAQRIVNSQGGAWMSVRTFVQTYAETEKDQQALYATLSLYDLAYDKPERDGWGMLTGDRVWVWETELSD